MNNGSSVDSVLALTTTIQESASFSRNANSRIPTRHSVWTAPVVCIPSGNLLHFELLRGDSPRVAVFPSPIVEQLNTVKYPNTSILFALE